MPAMIALASANTTRSRPPAFGQRLNSITSVVLGRQHALLEVGVAIKVGRGSRGNQRYLFASAATMSLEIGEPKPLDPCLAE
jgi:hypothetical protein